MPNVGNHPSDDAVHAVHDAYLLTVIEALNLCPFARKARELGRVARELMRGDDATWLAQTAAQRLRERTKSATTWEIVLLTFPQATDHLGLEEPPVFEALHRNFRELLTQDNRLDRAYYSVCFHPRLSTHSPHDR